MAIYTTTLINVSENSTGLVQELPDDGIRTIDVIQSGTGTWTIQVSNDKTALSDPSSVTWRTLKSGTSGNGYETNAPWKYIRATTSGMSGATIKILVGYVWPWVRG